MKRLSNRIELTLLRKLQEILMNKNSDWGKMTKTMNDGMLITTDVVKEKRVMDIKFTKGNHKQEIVMVKDKGDIVYKYVYEDKDGDVISYHRRTEKGGSMFSFEEEFNELI